MKGVRGGWKHQYENNNASVGLALSDAAKLSAVYLGAAIPVPIHID